MPSAATTWRCDVFEEDFRLERPGLWEEPGGGFGEGPAGECASEVGEVAACIRAVKAGNTDRQKQKADAPKWEAEDAKNVDGHGR